MLLLLYRAPQDLSRNMAHDIARGLAGLDKVVTEHQVAGVHGSA